ncbi:Hsp70 family protein [Hahella sp. HN01]|uniref:Hsp70 family protein n=1 Tax=Hahella sp. HN01 TaxID=2847262 RepID=UPI001C1EF1E5|nr:Hsp70 family protein [Hahella sp. HN01]MBU6951253.1 Hsp70 family protein [Hahella sp. HN01]
MSDMNADRSPRYSVGIDLGTTNCVLSYIELTDESGQALDEDQLRQDVMTVPQLTRPGSVEEKKQLPSFLYQPHESELGEGELALPWAVRADALVGGVARELGSKTPMRLVASAKSWLCHGGVDCRSDFLPLNSPEEVTRISPLAATIRYLEHLCNAWNHKHPGYPLNEQDVVVTVPASFDPAARDLTVEAVKAAGLGNLTLLEEPQAAVYNWIKASGGSWRDQVGVGDIVLVVDIGGGTTDLSLIAVTEQDGGLELNRVAVGEHILLGGDNMDLALAYRVKNKLAQEGKELQPWQIQAIVHGCRDAKEALLSDQDVNAVPIVVPSRGSKLLGGSLRTELTREEVQQTLVEGFFPQVGVHEHPKQQMRRALTQISLPYAQDAAVTRHLAAFLSRQHAAANELLAQNESEFIKPTAVLFNGGVLKAPALSSRLMKIINHWLSDAGAPSARLLQDSDLDLAVACGAAYYGYVRRGRGVRIRGGIASAYYVGIESAMPAVPGMEAPMEALCVAPFGMEEGSEVKVESQELGLIVGEPVRFKFFGSTLRRDDEPGMVLDAWGPDELEELPEIQASLPAEGRRPGEIVPVRLSARVTEVGTLCLEAIPRNGDARWQVEFDVREG